MALTLEQLVEYKQYTLEDILETLIALRESNKHFWSMLREKDEELRTYKNAVKRCGVIIDYSLDKHYEVK